MKIVVIHEQPVQLTGSDCCGKIDGKYADFHLEPLFRETREELTKIYRIIQYLKEHFKNIDLIYVDNRNVFGILAILWKIRRELKGSFWQKFRYFTLMFRVPCMFVQGIYVDLTQPADPEKLIKKIKDDWRG